MFDEVQYTILLLLLLVFCCLRLCVTLDHLFSSKSFIIFAVMFRSLIHFELCFIYNERVGVQLHCYICEYLFWMSWHHLLKRLFFAPLELSCHSRWKLGDSNSECLEPRRAGKAPAAPWGGGWVHREGVPGPSVPLSSRASVRWRDNPSHPEG